MARRCDHYGGVTSFGRHNCGHHEDVGVQNPKPETQTPKPFHARVLKGWSIFAVPVEAQDAF